MAIKPIKTPLTITPEKREELVNLISELEGKGVSREELLKVATNGLKVRQILKEG